MLEFDKEKHEYYSDGVQLPSVSELLRFISRDIYADADEEMLNKAADRGTRVHAACEELDRTKSADFDEDIELYVMAYARFLQEHNIKWKYIEEMMCTQNRPDINFAGTIDRYGIVNDRVTLMDIKTTCRIGPRQKMLYGCQLYFYDTLIRQKNWETGDVVTEPDMCVLQLCKDGTYNIIEINPREVKPVADAVLTLATAFKKKMKRKKDDTNG